MKLEKIISINGTIKLLSGLHIGGGSDVMHIGGIDKPTRQLLSLMREVIPEHNHNAFSLNIAIQDLLGIKNEKTPSLKISLTAVAKHCNAFYVEIFKSELKRFTQRGCSTLQ